VAQKETPIYVVLTMRSDFIGECGQFEGLAEMVNRGEFLIPRLTREQYKRVIEGPIKVAGGQIAPRLLQRLLNDLGQQADQLPCLQHALMRTWDVWRKVGRMKPPFILHPPPSSFLPPPSSLDLDDYQRVGKMSQALSLHADEIYDSLANDRQRELCKGIFQALTVEESNNRGIRRPQRLGRCVRFWRFPPKNCVPIIDAYRHSGVTFLMPSPEVELTEQTIIDISHESLMRVWTRLRQWVEEESQAAGIYHRLSESADLHEQGKAGLYRDPELGIALAWQEDKRPNNAWAERYRAGFAIAMSFLEASQQASIAEEQAREAARQRELEQAQQLAEAQQLRIEQQQRSARNSRKMIGGLALVATLAGLACVFALIAHNKANRLARIASLEAENALQKEAKAEQAQRTTAAALAEVAAEKNRAESSLERAKLAEMRSSELRERETVLKQIAEQKELEARRQYYASDSSNASYAARSADQFPRVAGYVARWSGEKNTELRDWEYYHLLTQIRLPTIEWDFRKITPGRFEHKTGVAWSPTGRRIATVRRAGNFIEVFDAELGERIWESVEFPLGSGQAIEWSPCGDLIAAGSTSGIVRVLAADSGEILAEFRAHEQCKRLKWCEDGARLLTCGGQEAKIWSTQNWTLLHTLRGQTADIVNIAHNSAGRVGACGADGLVTVWDANTGELLQNWSHGGDVVAWDWASATNRMAFASRSPVAITIRDVDSWSLERTLADERLGTADAAVGETMGSLSEIAWSPDGKLLATIGGGYGGGTRSLWDVPSGSLLDIAAQPGMIAIDWSDDGRMLATAGWQDRVQIWPLEITSMPKLLKGAANFCWGPGGRYLATSQKSEITIWDAYQWRPLQTLDGGTGEITSMCLSSDERLIAVADEQRNLRVWNLESEEVVRHFAELKAKFATVAFSPDQRWLSGVDGSSLLHVWNTESWEETTARVRGDFQKWSPDSRFILAGNGNFNFSGGEPSYALWETASKQLRNLDHYFFDPTRAAWNPDGTGAAIVSHTDNIVVLKLDAAGRPDVTGSYREMGRVHSSFIKQMDWSPIGNRMVTVGGEKLARIWDMQALQQVHEIENALDAGWDAYGLRLAVRTPVGVEIHDATIGGARAHWKQLLPMLAREQELGRISDGDLRTMCEIRCAHGEWGSAIQTIAELMERNPADVRNQHLAGETFLRYAGIPLRAEGALGVRMSTQALQLPESDNAPRLGYKLTEVIPDGPADRSGLQPDDVVTRIQEYREFNLSEAIKVTSPGSTLGIELYRNGQRLRMPLRIGYLNTTGETARSLPVDAETIDRTIDGLHDARDFIRRARDIYLRLCQAEPGHPVHLKRLILTLSFLPSDEVTQWQQSLHRDAKFHAASLALHRYQGEQAIWLERFDEAARCFEAALRLGGDRDENTVTVELAAPHRVVLERLAPYLNQAIDSGSSDGDLYAARGILLLKQQQSDTARVDLEKSLELKPNPLAAQFTGRSLARPI
jgi:WD40 repeat protein